MFNTLLSKNKSIKIQLFYQFYQNQEQLLELNELAIRFECTTKKLNRYIQEINEEIKNLCLEEDLICKVSTATFRLNSDYRDSLPEIYDNVKYSYLNESLLFQFILYVSTNKGRSINQLCESLMVCSSHAYHLLKEANAAMDKFNISISLNQQKKLYFSGEELNIRLYMYHFFTSCIPENDWKLPLSKDYLCRMVKDVLPNHSISRHSVNDMSILFGILYLRLTHSFYLNPASHHDLENELNLFNQKDIQSHCFFSSYITDQQVLACEKRVFTFFIQVFFEDMICPEEMQQIAVDIIKNNSIKYRFIAAFIDKYTTQFQLKLSDERFHQLIYYYYLFFLLTLCTKDINLVELWNLQALIDTHYLKPLTMHQLLTSKSDIDSFKEINTLYTELARDDSYIKIKEFLLKKNNLYHFSSISYIHLKIFNTCSLPVYLHFTKDYITKKYVQEKLLTIYHPNLINFTNDYENAYIMVTDTPHQTKSSNTTILINDAFDSNQFRLILEVISRTLIEKEL